MAEEKNPILEFSWEKDIRPDVRVSRSYATPKPQTYLSDGTPWGVSLDTRPLFEREEADKLQLKDKQGLERPIKVNILDWSRSLDRYLYQYFLLIETKSMAQTKSDWVKYDLPDQIAAKLDNYIEAKKIGRARKLPVTLDLLEEYAGSGYKIPRYFRACYLNQVCRGLAADSTATTSLLAPQQDGVAFWKNIEGEYPRFEIEDYWLHEKTTGISLTIEISAVFLEVGKKHKDDALWDKALETFIRKALPTIVRSPLFFTRNTVARRFFQQILMEQSIPSDQCNQTEISDWQIETYWNELIERATFHLNVLVPNPEVYNVPLPQVDEAISHIQKLLASVAEPVNMPAYVNDPKRGLAPFCDTRHAKVSYFTDRLYISKNDSIRMNSKSQLTAFARIRKAVKEAIHLEIITQQLRDDPSEYSEVEDTQIKDAGRAVEISFWDSVPAQLWKYYARLANEEGGTILLTRPLPYKRYPQLDGQKKYKTFWTRNASEIIDEICQKANNPKIIDKNALSEESIRVWEYFDCEILEIAVHKAAPGELITYIPQSV